MHATYWFLPWILSTYYDLRVSQHNNRRNDYFSPLFFVSKMHLVHLPPCHKICHRQRACCVIRHRCVWPYSYVHKLPARDYKSCLFARTCITTFEAPGTQPLAMLLCGFFWASNRNHYHLLLDLVMGPLATTISMYVRVPTEIH